MADKKKYYKLDDIGFVGKQEKKSGGPFSYHAKKTGEIFHQHRQAQVYVPHATAKKTK